VGVTVVLGPACIVVVGAAAVLTTYRGDELGAGSIDTLPTGTTGCCCGCGTSLLLENMLCSTGSTPALTGTTTLAAAGAGG
jgi:hypothetical protein